MGPGLAGDDGDAVEGDTAVGKAADALGDGVELAPGTQVTVMPLRWCGECPACVAGHQHICQRLDFVGIDSPGALQQLWTVPASIVVFLVCLSQSSQFRQLFQRKRAA